MTSMNLGEFIAQMQKTHEIDPKLKAGMFSALGKVGLEADKITQKLDEVRTAHAGASAEEMKTAVKTEAMAAFNKEIEANPLLKNAHLEKLVEGYVGNLIDRSFERDEKSVPPAKFGTNMEAYLADLGTEARKLGKGTIEAIGRFEVTGLIEAKANETAITKALAASAGKHIFAPGEEGKNLDKDFIDTVSEKAPGGGRNKIAEKADDGQKINSQPMSNIMMIFMMIFTALFGGGDPASAGKVAAHAPNPAAVSQAEVKAAAQEFDKSPENKKRLDAEKELEQRGAAVDGLMKVTEKLIGGTASDKERAEVGQLLGVKIDAQNQKNVGEAIQKNGEELRKGTIVPADIGEKINAADKSREEDKGKAAQAPAKGVDPVFDTLSSLLGGKVLLDLGRGISAAYKIAEVNKGHTGNLAVQPASTGQVVIAANTTPGGPSSSR